MPRISRRVPLHSLKYTSSHVFQLTHGHDFFGDAFGNGDDAIEAMRDAWPELRDQVFELNESRCARYVEPTDRRKQECEQYGYPFCGLMPWGWWRFESEEPRDETMSEADQLRRLGVKIPTRYAGARPLSMPSVPRMPKDTIGQPGYPPASRIFQSAEIREKPCSN